MSAASLALLSFVFEDAHAVYGDREVNLTTTGYEKCISNWPYWGVDWGAFPPLRAPYTQLQFSLMSRATYGDSQWNIHSTVWPRQFNGSNINANMCTIQRGGLFYRIQLHATGGGADDVYWVSIQLYTGGPPCPPY